MKSLGGPMGLALGLVSAGATLLASAGCSTPFVVGSSTTGTGTGGGTGGGTSSTGTGGTGGAAACTQSTCPTDQYCNSQSGACESCGQSTRFSFGAPVQIPLGLPVAGASALYPRVDAPTGNLFLVQQAGASHLNQIAEALYSGKPLPWATAILVPQLAGGHADSGPFPLQDPSQLAGLVSDTISKLGMPVLLFDSDRAGGRHVFAIGLQQATPTLLMLPGGASSESRISVATAASPPRFFWISNAGSGGDHLVTTTAALDTATPVTITLDTGCVTPVADTPWVTPGGDRLVFSSPEYGPSPACTAANATVTHLYHVALDGSGQPTGKAVRVFPSDSSTDTTPALGPNRCQLLFSRVQGSAVSVYASTRD